MLALVLALTLTLVLALVLIPILAPLAQTLRQGEEEQEHHVQDLEDQHHVEEEEGEVEILIKRPDSVLLRNALLYVGIQLYPEIPRLLKVGAHLQRQLSSSQISQSRPTMLLRLYAIWSSCLK